MYFALLGARVERRLETPVRHTRGADLRAHGLPSLRSLRGRQNGTTLVWEDSNTGSIHRQATASHCKGQICVQLPPTILNEVECMAHPLWIDQRRGLYPLSLSFYFALLCLEKVRHAIRELIKSPSLLLGQTMQFCLTARLSNSGYEQADLLESLLKKETLTYSRNRVETMLSNINNYIRQVKSTHDDDSIDRLNYVTTIYMLLGFALTLFAKNYVGEPMQCWVPNQWTAVWEVFSESYCFVENTYFVPMNDSNMPAVHTREGRKMIYYQWVPFILSLMAFCFYIPRGIWKIFSPYSGLALADLMTAARRSAKTGEEDKMIYSMVTTLRKVHTSKVVRYGSSLFNLYIIMKVLIFVNLLLQFFLLNHFLGTAYTFWGAGILFDMIRGRQWQNSGHFPRVAFCDLTVREMGNVNNWTVQCVLMVNMFNEKIFIFLWFWFAFLLFCTVINLFIWIHRRISRAARMAFLYDVLTDSGLDTSVSDREEFYEDVVKDDGILVLLLLDANGGRLQSGELVNQLWSSKFPQNSEKTISTVAEDEPHLNDQLWNENYPS
ncbi:hypothetical protein Angca_004838, partial [Angiostrongylus cantonensis]